VKDVLYNFKKKLKITHIIVDVLGMKYNNYIGVLINSN